MLVFTRADQKTGNQSFLRFQIFMMQTIEYSPELKINILMETGVHDFLPKVYEEFAARSILYREIMEGLVVPKRDSRYLPVDGSHRPMYTLDPCA
jgi:hypothetical protein